MSEPGGPEELAAVEAAEDVPEAERRAELLPEEQAAGSDDPRVQAATILEESVQRTEDVDPDDSSQSGRRSSADTVDPLP